MKHGGTDPNPGRLWGVAHMDAGIWFTAATRRECVLRLGYASQPRRTHYSGGVYYYHAREGGHDAFVGRVRALLASGFTLEIPR